MLMVIIIGIIFVAILVLTGSCDNYKRKCYGCNIMTADYVGPIDGKYYCNNCGKRYRKNITKSM